VGIIFHCQKTPKEKTAFTPVSVSTVPKSANQDIVRLHTEIREVAGVLPPSSPFF